MGEFTDNGIQCFEPDDTDTTIYIPAMSEVSLIEIVHTVKDKWAGISMADVTIGAEHIKTRHIGYDLYDGADWTDYIVITRDK